MANRNSAKPAERNGSPRYLHISGERALSSGSGTRRMEFAKAWLSPVRANVNSQGDQPTGRCPPLVLAKTNRQPRKGGRRLLSPLQGSAPLHRQVQGLTPLATDCRPSGALRPTAGVTGSRPRPAKNTDARIAVNRNARPARRWEARECLACAPSRRWSASCRPSPVRNKSREA
jgi:hypothetical protein